MIPLRDINPTRRFPIITVALIAANALVFIYQFLQPSQGAMSALMHSSGLVPYNLTQGSDPFTLSTLVTSLFLHGGVIHITGNMLGVADESMAAARQRIHEIEAHLNACTKGVAS